MFADFFFLQKGLELAQVDLTQRSTESLRNLQYLKLSFAHNSHMTAKVFEERACKINHPIQTLKSCLQCGNRNDGWNTRYRMTIVIKNGCDVKRQHRLVMQK